MTTLAEEKSYRFMDFIRFVAVCAIIFQHSFIVKKELLLLDYPSMALFFFLKMITKIGSVSFFLVSGFLLSSALERYSLKEYLNKRVKSIFKPYVLFVLAYLMLQVAGAFFGKHILSSISEFPVFVVSKIFDILFFTSYWFVFNYFISVTILLTLRKYLYERWLGVVLCCCTLVYAVNVHFEWFPPYHTTAFLGFTFFLWLGANLKKQEQTFECIIQSTPYWKIILLVLTTLSVSLCETWYLMEAGATVVDSSLNFTCILYALSVFLLLCKLGQNVRFSFVSPRDETYPLYLIHPIFLKIINYALLPMLPAIGSLLTLDKPGEISWLAILMYQTGWFLAIYTFSLLSVKIILYSAFRWVFGKQGKAVSPGQSSRVLINEVQKFKNLV